MTDENLMKYLLFLSLILLQSCANLYREKSYVTDVGSSGKLKGLCAPTGSQNRFSYEGKSGIFSVSLPIHYDYWWTGPLVFPIFPRGTERKDPSFIKVTLTAEAGKLQREELLKAEVLIKNIVEPVLPINVITNRVTDKNSDSFTVQFEAPKLIDVPEFRLKLPPTIAGEIITFRLATDTHYVPILPIVLSDCVVD